MPPNYLEEFPIPLDSIPPRLRALLQPISRDPNEMVSVTTRWDSEEAEPKECEMMLMAVVPESDIKEISKYKGTGDGVVSYSVPFFDKKGAAPDVKPNIHGHDYVVASWGDGSSYTFSLAEKVWMTMGLTPRCLGNDDQKLVYDDLGAPRFGIAAGEVSAQFHWSASRNVNWRMSNEYLRKYLWVRGAVGVRYFFYQAQLPDSPEFRALMEGQKHYCREREEDWFILDIREWEGGLLLQVWATVIAVDCELCPAQSADALIWPDFVGPMTRARANSILAGGVVYLSDNFLEKYEQNALYNTTPGIANGQFSCAPSYRGQWSFSNFRRIGRNLIKTTIRDIYKGVPEVEVIHAHAFALSAAQAGQHDMAEEHIVSKIKRLLDQILDLGDGLSQLGKMVGVEATPEEWVHFSREKLAYSGWAAYSQLQGLAKVAPLNMPQHAFVSRCKSLHEVLQRIPDGLLRRVLLAAGCPKAKLQDRRSLKLLEALLNIIGELDRQKECAQSLKSADEPAGWALRNELLAPLFLTNDLRIADAHDAAGNTLQALQDMGFDTASLGTGYGRALDYVLDAYIKALAEINSPLHRILNQA